MRISSTIPLDRKILMDQNFETTYCLLGRQADRQAIKVIVGGDAFKIFEIKSIAISVERSVLRCNMPLFFLKHKNNYDTLTHPEGARNPKSIHPPN